jgi:hypothetical protein
LKPNGQNVTSEERPIQGTRGKTKRRKAKKSSRADEKLNAFVELESAIRACGELS